MTSVVCSRASRAISVLFVDDDADTLHAYRLLATDEGLLVEIAQDGPSAIAVATLVLPDVIVLDIGLRGVEGLDGFEVARRLRTDARTSAIPIIIVSGYDSDRDRAQVKASGCEGHLVKPCSADALLRLVTDVARQHGIRLSTVGPNAQEQSA